MAPILGVALLVAATTLVAGAAFHLATAATGEALTADPGGVAASFVLGPLDADRQRIELRYRAGPPLDVRSLAIVVDVAGGPTGRLVELPAGRDGHCYGDRDDVVTPENVAGDAIFSRACGDARGAITAKPPGVGRWHPGDDASMRLRHGDHDRPGVDLEPGDVVTVTVIDTGRDVVLDTSTARAG